MFASSTKHRIMKFHVVYSYFEKGCLKNVYATIPKGNMGYDQYTVPDDCSCRTYFCCFPLALANTFPWPFVPILSNFFEKQRTQNHPQCLSGLSRALFPTTFLKIAVLIKQPRRRSKHDLLSECALFRISSFLFNLVQFVQC